MFKKLTVLFLLGFITILSFALDDQGNPNDPTVNERANACYEDGSMAGKCDTDWEWEGGWYIIRFQYGLISREDFPAQYAILLPPLPEDEDASVAWPPSPEVGGCQYMGSAGYIDFGSGNTLTGSITVFVGSDCTIMSAGGVFGTFVYTTKGQAAADYFCDLAASGTTANLVASNVYKCL